VDSETLFDKGYAIPSYGIDKGIQRFVFRDERYAIPVWSVSMWHVGENFEVAKIEEVRHAAQKAQAKA
jgi:hypothetical protein